MERVTARLASAMAGVKPAAFSQWGFCAAAAAVALGVQFGWPAWNYGHWVVAAAVGLLGIPCLVWFVQVYTGGEIDPPEPALTLMSWVVGLPIYAAAIAASSMANP